MLMQRLTRRDPDGAANFADAEFESVCAELTPANREKVRATRTNFKSFAAYASYERRANGA